MTRLRPRLLVKAEECSIADLLARDVRLPLEHRAICEFEAEEKVGRKQAAIQRRF